jgi:2,3-bisphosphoglycerate-independent phosphoglycerate mutase
MRRLICGNWKMHKTVEETVAYIAALREREHEFFEAFDVAIAPPFTALAAASAALEGSRVALAAQNVHWERSGAFTGEISTPMLVELGVRYVIVGHSERRQYFGETDETVNKRTRAALDAGLTPIVCVGESLSERESGDAKQRVVEQTRAALEGLSDAEVARVVMAYEPIWAIGTGRNCDADDADETMSAIRGSVPGLRDANILYGGSVKTENIGAYAAKLNINGGLVGGASLDPEGFVALILAAHPAPPLALAPAPEPEPEPEPEPKTYRPVVLAVLDGWGCRDATHGNAIAAAKLPHWRAFFDRYPWTTLEASGEAVGLPKGVMGNSEVGHMNMGSGRVVPQGVTIIDQDIASGDFSRNETLQQAIADVQRTGGRLHLMGLLSDGQVHSSITHLITLIDAAAEADVPFEVHVFLDGRDTPPRSAERYVEQLESALAKVGRTGAIATVTGRYYAMDRDQRWERTQLAYDLLTRSAATYHEDDALSAVRAGYARGEDDEFLAPTTVGLARPIRDGDALIFINFRPDRARQLTAALNAGARAYKSAEFTHFPVERYDDLFFATMTQYEETFPNPVLFGPRAQFETFGEVLSSHGLRQLRLAETEKYAHVTYFFNGGREDVFEGEDRKLIPSDRSVPTYDLAPAMRAVEITDAAIEAISTHEYDAIVMNYANADMVGHTGKWKPTIESLEVLDECLQRLADAVMAAGGLLAITADHGNAEDKIDAKGGPLTAHTTNPVPFLLIGEGLTGTLRAGGKLGDIAPTLLHIMDVPVPERMTGDNLFEPSRVGSRT